MAAEIANDTEYRFRESARWIWERCLHCVSFPGMEPYMNLALAMMGGKDTGPAIDS